MHEMATKETRCNNKQKTSCAKLYYRYFRCTNIMHQLCCTCSAKSLLHPPPLKFMKCRAHLWSCRRVELQSATDRLTQQRDGRLLGLGMRGRLSYTNL